MPADALDLQLGDNITVSYNVIAGTGWTAARLLSAIQDTNPSDDFDLVTLLIGVNNQFQNLPFTEFENDFATSADKAIELAKGDNNRVVVISIPDYAYTPFGQSSTSPETISSEIDAYNSYIENYCQQNKGSEDFKTTDQNIVKTSQKWSKHTMRPQ